MKSLRQACAIASLSMALVGSVSAGIISSPGAAAPPPPPTSSTTSDALTEILITMLGTLYR